MLENSQQLLHFTVMNFHIHTKLVLSKHSEKYIKIKRNKNNCKTQQENVTEHSQFS